MGVLGELVKQGRHFQQLIEADSLALQSDIVKSFDKDGDVPFGLIFCPDSDGKKVHAMQETRVLSPTHSSIPVWRTPWKEEPVKLQFMGSQRLRHN